MEKDSNLASMDDTEIHHDQQPSTSRKQSLPRIKVNWVTKDNPRDESYIPSKFVCSVMRKFVLGEYGDVELEEIFIMPSSRKRPSPPSLGEPSNSKKICHTANSSSTSDPPISAESDPPVTFVPDHMPSTSAKRRKFFVPQITVELLSSSDKRPSTSRKQSLPHIKVNLANGSCVSSNPNPPVLSNSHPFVSLSPHPPVSSNLHFPVLLNSRLPVLLNPQPIAGNASSNSDPPTLSNRHPPMFSNPHPPMSSNPHPPMLSNLYPSGSSDPQPCASSNSDPDPQPDASSNSDPPMLSNRHQPVSSDPQPDASSNFDPPTSSNPHPSVSSVPHIRKTQSTNVPTPLTVTTRAQRNEYVKSLPSGFRLLNHLKPNNQCANFVGVVTDLTPPRQSKGSDYYTKIYIVDPFFSQCSREIMWFESPLHMPNIYRSGEIVLFSGIKCRNYKDQLQLIKSNETKIMVIPRNDDPEVMKTARTPHVQLHPKFAKAIEVLKGWLAENIHLFDAVKFDLLSSVLEVDKYINICVKLCKMVYTQDKVIFTVWDGTIPFIKVPLRGVRKESIEEKVVFDVTSEFEKEKLLELKVKGSFGTKTNMAEFKLKPKAVLAFYGVLVKKRKNGHLKLLLEDTDRVPLGFSEVKSTFIQSVYRHGRFSFKRW